MATAIPACDLECPVCHEDFTEAKFLPCGHVLCRKCILSWLAARGQGGCPLCRAPFLPTLQPGQDEMAVDSLPTDLVTMALVESKLILSGEKLCGVCDNNIASTSYCLDCSIKLCKACTRSHKRVTATRDHRLEELDTLTPGRLAASRRSPCVSHADRPADMYCPAHLSLICVECFSVFHHSCGVKPVANTAKQERAALADQAKRFRDKESAMTARVKQLQKEVDAAQAHFRTQRSEVNATFGRLQQMMVKRSHAILAQLQREEDDVVRPKQADIASLEVQKAALAVHADSVERLMVPAPDGALLEMLTQMKARLDDLEKKSEVPQVTVSTDVTLVSVSWDSGMMTRLEQAIGVLGHVTDTFSESIFMSTTADGLQQCLVCGLSQVVLKKKPTGRKLAKVLKVGDRVKRGQDWDKKYADKDCGGAGTVIPSYRGCEVGWVFVRWDTSREDVYRMGFEGCYDLELA